MKSLGLGLIDAALTPLARRKEIVGQSRPNDEISSFTLPFQRISKRRISLGPRNFLRYDQLVEGSHVHDASFTNRRD